MGMDHAAARELDNITTYAMRLWGEMYADRAHAGDPDHKSAVHYDKIDAALAKYEGTIRGTLLRIAVDDARTRDLPAAGLPPAEHLAVVEQASAEIHSVLDAERHRLAPPPQLQVPDQSTHCRHNRPYSGECADCDADFA